jgi:hypothetical protein
MRLTEIHSRYDFSQFSKWPSVTRAAGGSQRSVVTAANPIVGKPSSKDCGRRLDRIGVEHLDVAKARLFRCSNSGASCRKDITLPRLHGGRTQTGGPVC